MLGLRRGGVLALALSVLGCNSHHAVVDSDAGPPRRVDASVSGPGDAGPDWSQPPGAVHGQVSCYLDGVADLLVEIYDPATPACEPPASGTATNIVAGIDEWDGQSGTFVLGEITPRGRATASATDGPGPLEGTLEVYVTGGQPTRFELHTSAGDLTTDLSVCGRSELPCVDLSVSPEDVTAGLRCEPDGSSTFTFLYHPSTATPSCEAATPSAGDLQIELRDWRGYGAYVVTGDGGAEATASRVGESAPLTGTISVEAGSPGRPSYIEWSLGDGPGERGHADLAACADALALPGGC